MKRIVLILVAALCCTAALAQEYVPTPVTVSKEKVKFNGKVYLSHVVLERQTIYGITKAYGVTEEELYEANPSLKESGLQKNAIILVPYRDQAQAPVKEVKAEASAYTEHTVKWYEDIDDIARRYNISVKALMEYNGLRSRKLETRQVLRIPVSHVEYTPEAVAQEPAAPAQDAEAPETPDTTAVLPAFTPKQEVEFSLVLPMKAGAEVSGLNMDFYSGVLMAVKDLEADGLKIKMNVFDLMAGMPQAETLTRGDFVLGPIAPLEVEAVLQRVGGRVPVVSPLDARTATLAHGYSNFVLAPSTVERQWEDLAAWVGEDLSVTDKIILVTEKGASNVAASVAIRSALAAREIPYEILSYTLVEGIGIPAILEEMLAEGGENRMVVASESEAFVGDVVRNIGIMLTKGYRMVMYAPSKVRSFETIEGSDFHAAQLHVSTTYYADYTDEKVEEFVKAYRALFRTEPSQFAFQGYDTARFFIERSTRGVDELRGLHMDISLEPLENGNAANKAVRRIVYKKDFTTELKK